MDYWRRYRQEFICHLSLKSGVIDIAHAITDILIDLG